MPEQRTARLTVLVDPDKKAVFERLCDWDDVTPSQVVRRLIREFIEQRTGVVWQPGEDVEAFFAKAGLAVEAIGERAELVPAR